MTPPHVVGFTGTQHGMTPAQRARVTFLVARADEAHHGDCIGSDAEFHEICLAAGIPVVIHPPMDPKKRAFCTGAVRVEPTKGYIERNHDIVRASVFVIATPRETVEPAPARGQGTWSTVRFTRKIGVALAVVMPDGSIDLYPTSP